MSEPTGWRRSSFCASGECVEVRVVDAGGVPEVLQRQSGRPEALRYAADEWRAFIAGAKAGEFDLPE